MPQGRPRGRDRARFDPGSSVGNQSTEKTHSDHPENRGRASVLSGLHGGHAADNDRTEIFQSWGPHGSRRPLRELPLVVGMAM